MLNIHYLKHLFLVPRVVNLFSPLPCINQPVEIVFLQCFGRRHSCNQRLQQRRVKVLARQQQVQRELVMLQCFFMDSDLLGSIIWITHVLLLCLGRFVGTFQSSTRGHLFNGAVSRHPLRPDIFGAQPQQEAAHG